MKWSDERLLFNPYQGKGKNIAGDGKKLLEDIQIDELVRYVRGSSRDKMAKESFSGRGREDRSWRGAGGRTCLAPAGTSIGRLPGDGAGGR